MPRLPRALLPLTQVPILRALLRIVRNVGSPAHRGHPLRAMWCVIRYDVRTRLLKKVTRAPIGTSSTILCYPGETNSPHAAYRNPPNPREMFVWRERLRPGDLFVDVGTNIGIYTIYALDLGATTISCEPDPHNFARLTEHIELNGFTDRAEALNVAVADQPGTLHLSQGLDSFNHLVFDGSGIEVPARTLDDILGERRVAGLKIDVEGAERLVLEGAERALSEQRIALIQLEWAGIRAAQTLGEGRDRVAAILEDAGYELYRPDDRGALHPVTPTDELEGLDVFAVPRVRD